MSALAVSGFAVTVPEGEKECDSSAAASASIAIDVIAIAEAANTNLTAEEEIPRCMVVRHYNLAAAIIRSRKILLAWRLAVNRAEVLLQSDRPIVTTSA
jgi:hypothetical protein